MGPLPERNKNRGRENSQDGKVFSTHVRQGMKCRGRAGRKRGVVIFRKETFHSPGALFAEWIEFRQRLGVQVARQPSNQEEKSQKNGVSMAEQREAMVKNSSATLNVRRIKINSSCKIVSTIEFYVPRGGPRLRYPFRSIAIILHLANRAYFRSHCRERGLKKELDFTVARAFVSAPRFIRWWS